MFIKYLYTLVSTYLLQYLLYTHTHTLYYLILILTPLGIYYYEIKTQIKELVKVYTESM